jgi:sugar-phosphatase
MIKAVIFDLDGTLIDSEPLWKEAEKMVFGQLGLSLTTEDCRKTMGLGVHQVVKFWYDHLGWKSDKPLDEIAGEILQKVSQLIYEKAQLKEGVQEITDFFLQKELPMVIASSSPKSYIKDFVRHFKLDHVFKKVFSALDEEYVKPHPAVYISAARYLGVDCENCLAFEDSFVGLLAARSALMKAVAVLETNDYPSTKFDFADIKLNALNKFDEYHWEVLNKKD